MNSPEFTWSAHASLSSVPTAVHQRLSTFFEHSEQEFHAIGSEFAHAVSILKNFTLLGGKRVRPTFAWAGIRAGLEGGGGTTSFALPADNPNPEFFLNAIAAMELIQACALIHDDIIDHSDTRRGHPTAHRLFQRRHIEKCWSGASEHYGTSLAVLTGDLALAWADDMLCDSQLTPQALAHISHPWRAMRTEVIAGQILDVTLEANGSESVEDSLHVNSLKTASYTVARPLHIGAAMVGADPRIITTLRTLGQDIGEAFQLRDDQLGVFGDPDITGKPSGDDLRTGKRTVLINWALQHGRSHHAQELRDGLGHATTEEDIDRLRAIIIATGAAEEIEQWITARSTRAIETIHSAGLEDTITAELVEMTTTLSNRTF